MSSQRFPRARRVSAFLSVAALLFVFIAACGGGDDDDGDATSTTGSSATTATVGSSGSTTATAATTDEATPTTDAAGDTTATTGGTDAATATSDTASDATATTADDDATATSGGSASTPDSSSGEDPLDDFVTLDPDELPNFSLTSMTDIENVDETTGVTRLVLEIQQADVDNYHMRIDTGDAEGLIETWRIGDRTWTSTAGVVAEDPTGMGSFFSPSLFLQQQPNLADEINAEKIGEEEVSGRETTHYRGSAEEILKAMQAEDQTGFLQGAVDPEGEADFWIDNELKILIRTRMDVSWTNTNGTTGVLKQEYDIFDIGDTEPIEAPQ